MYLADKLYVAEISQITNRQTNGRFVSCNSSFSTDGSKLPAHN